MESPEPGRFYLSTRLHRAGRRADRTLISAGLHKVELCSVCLSAKWTEPDLLNGRWWWMVLVRVRRSSDTSEFLVELKEAKRRTAHLVTGPVVPDCVEVYGRWWRNTRTQNIYSTCTCTPADASSSPHQPPPTPSSLLQPPPTPTSLLQPPPAPTSLLQPPPAPTSLLQPPPASSSLKFLWLDFLYNMLVSPVETVF